MKKQPEWYTAEVERHAKLVVEKEETPEFAITALRVLARDTHREFGNAIIDRFNLAYLEVTVNALTPRKTTPDPDFERHATLFPDLPFRSLRVTPKVYRRIPAMTGHDLDMAKNILMAKTQNSIDGSEAERRRFMAFYEKIRPLMDEETTVAEAEAMLAASRTPA